ncbi:MAG: dihydroorotate dehydrogenase-like protein [Terrimicrobiaceae bacterium]
MNTTLCLESRYLGLKLETPFVVGASPLSDDLSTLQRLEAAGAGAVVMHSLFEEQLARENAVTGDLLEGPADSFGEALSYFPSSSDYALGPEEYLERISLLKSGLAMPVIASLNGCTPGGWVRHAELIEEAGADALELNIYDVVTDESLGAEDVEKRLIDIVVSVRERTRIPLAVKLAPFYTTLPSVVKRLHLCGANGVVLFNRFYQPDLDIEELAVEPRLYLSTSSELLLRLRWMAILYGRFPVSLALSGGVHKCSDAVKGVMAGADVLQVVSLILRNGVDAFSELVEDFRRWMGAHEYSQVSQMRGALSHANSPDPAGFERANYLRTLQLWKV